MKGIILAGGSGTRLYPITLGISKQIMPIYNKPMIYYPLSVLLEAGINEILIITNPENVEVFMRLLGSGENLGCRFSYAAQEKPRGLCDAFIVGENFIGKDRVTLILGDNIFYGDGLGRKIKENKEVEGGMIFAAQVEDPWRYGVAEFNKDMKVISIEEKPEKPKSDYAIPGLYIFDNRVVEFAKKVKPSERGEIEITEVQKMYLRLGKLKACVLDRGTAWLDTGTFSSMMAAAEFVKVVEERQGIMIGCIEEAAYRAGLIGKDRLLELAEKYIKSGYGKYLKKVAGS